MTSRKYFLIDPYCLIPYYSKQLELDGLLDSTLKPTVAGHGMRSPRRGCPHVEGAGAALMICRTRGVCVLWWAAAAAAVVCCAVVLVVAMYGLNGLSKDALQK